MNSVEWNFKYNLFVYVGDDKSVKYYGDEGRYFSFCVSSNINLFKLVVGNELIRKYLYFCVGVF